MDFLKAPAVATVDSDSSQEITMAYNRPLVRNAAHATTSPLLSSFEATCAANGQLFGPKLHHH